MSVVSEPSTSRVGVIPIRTFRGATPGPAILFFHGLRASSEGLDAEARAFAAAGITAIMVDAPHHGARRDTFLETMPDTATREGYRRLLTIFREARDEVPSLVDHAQAAGHTAIAIGGVSLGGYIALAAAGEPRLAAIVSLLGSPDWTPHEGEGAAAREHFAEALAESPHLRPEVFVPRPLLMITGTRDVNVPPAPTRALHARLRPLYAEAGADAALVHREFDTAHAVAEPMWRAMIALATSFCANTLRN